MPGREIVRIGLNGPLSPHGNVVPTLIPAGHDGEQLRGGRPIRTLLPGPQKEGYGNLGPPLADQLAGGFGEKYVLTAEPAQSGPILEEPFVHAVLVERQIARTHADRPDSGTEVNMYSKMVA